jgi:hypothetical protein
MGYFCSKPSLRKLVQLYPIFYCSTVFTFYVLIYRSLGFVLILNLIMLLLMVVSLATYPRTTIGWTTQHKCIRLLQNCRQGGRRCSFSNSGWEFLDWCAWSWVGPRPCLGERSRGWWKDHSLGRQVAPLFHNSNRKLTGAFWQVLSCGKIGVSMHLFHTAPTILTYNIDSFERKCTEPTQLRESLERQYKLWPEKTFVFGQIQCRESRQNSRYQIQDYGGNDERPIGRLQKQRLVIDRNG